MNMRGGRLVTIGSFDGVHVGHQALLSRTVTEAKKRQLKPMALTFHVPPRMILDPSSPFRVLSSKAEKEALLRIQGIEEVLSLNFNHKFAAMKPFAFFRNFLLEDLKARGVVVGMDFRFGLGRAAGALELVRWGEEFEIPVWVIPAVKCRRQVVSSSLIRHLIESNHFKQALCFLGHPYLIQGKVAPDRQMGRKLGFPTANLVLPKGKILPRGVFAVRGMVLGARNPAFEGVCNIGTRPTFLRSPKVVVEVHIFGDMPRLSGKTLQVELLHRLRSEKKFESKEQLARAIASDVYRAKAFLS